MQPFNFTYDKKTDSYIITSYYGEEEDVIIPLFYNNKLITKIGDSAFEGLNIKSIRIPDTIVSIGNYAFAGCDYLQIKGGFPKYLEEIGEGAFTGVFLENIVLPDTCTKIGDIAFDPLVLESIKLPSYIKELPIEFLGGAHNLKEVRLPETLKTLKRDFFSCCTALEKIYLPKSLKLIEENAFFDCVSLKEIEYEGSEYDFNNIKVEQGNGYLRNCKVCFE